MSSPDLVKLKNAGEALTLRVTHCEPLRMGSYPEVEFVGLDTKGARCAVRVPQKAADRQLSRAAVTYDSVRGQWLCISRDPNDSGKPFWGIVVVDGPSPTDSPYRTPAREAAPAPQPKPQQAKPQQSAPRAEPSATPQNRQREHQAPRLRKQGAALYLELTKFALARVVPLYKEQNIPVTMEGVGACVATMFIQANH